MAPEDPGFKTLCPTRWTVRAASLQSVMRNYSVIQSSLDSFEDMTKRDPEMSARCAGVASQFASFDFFLFGVALGEKVLSMVDNLSKALQHKNMSAAQGQVCLSVCHCTCPSLEQRYHQRSFKRRWLCDSKKRSKENNQIQQ